MPAIHDSRYSWFRLLITMAIGTVANVGIWAIIVIMPAVEADFGADRASASLPYVMTMIGFALGNMLIGRLLDRYGVTRALIGAALVSAIGFALSALAPSILFLSAAHLLLGLGTAAGFGPLIADISHWFLRRRGIAVALVASSNYLAGAIWPLLLSGILARHGWQTVYVTLAVITL
ncbi:MAG: MFS transporter, partial [Pseudomonadota bacterium]